MANIRDLSEGFQAEGFYALREVSLRESRRGSQYIRLVLGDATGSISGNIWDVTERDQYLDIQDQFNDLSTTKVVKARGNIESYNGMLQFKVDRIRPASPEEEDEALKTLVAETPLNRDELLEELKTLIGSIEDTDYRNLVGLFFDDESFVAKFKRATAAKQFHHAYIGGLLEHTVSLLRICDLYCRTNSELRRDLLFVGAIFHDVGKIEEMSVSTSIDYTDEGSLLGHLVQGVLMIEDRIKGLSDFSRDKRNLVYHMILSHHGRFEYGSPVMPKIPEAVALHFIDNLDAKVYAAHKAIAEDPNEASAWTDKSFMLETRVFKG